MSAPQSIFGNATANTNTANDGTVDAGTDGTTDATTNAAVNAIADSTTEATVNAIAATRRAHSELMARIRHTVVISMVPLLEAGDRNLTEASNYHIQQVFDLASSQTLERIQRSVNTNTQYRLTLDDLKQLITACVVQLAERRRVRPDVVWEEYRALRYANFMDLDA